jgi:hypothetical protein
MSRHHPSILHTTDLYVTVEPCVMCASALRQFGIRSVYFGCLNDRFGGTGGVMTVHMDEGVDPPYPVYGGLFREEAIMLLRRFYVQENDKGKFIALICGFERRRRLTVYLQLRSRSPRRTVSSRQRSCLLVCQLEATLQPTPSHLLLAYLLLVRLLAVRLHPVRLHSARLLSVRLLSARLLSALPPSRHPPVETDRISCPATDAQTSRHHACYSKSTTRPGTVPRKF